MRSKLKAAVFPAVLAATLAAPLVHAQGSFPSRPVTIIMPVAPGSAIEHETRSWTDLLTVSLGQPIVLDFKPGGGSLVALNQLAQAKPDGHTLAAANINVALIPLRFDNASLDVRTLEYVSLLNKRINYVIVGGQLPITNIKELVAYSKANPGKLNFAANGEGSIDHIMGVWLMSATGADATFIHYKSAAAQTVDLLAGRVHVAQTSLEGAQAGLISSGKLRAIGAQALTRSSLAPDIPTLQEQGIPEYEAPGFVGLVAPPKTPAAIVNRLAGDIGKASKAPELQKRLGASVIAVGSSPAEFRQFMEKTTARFGALAKQFNINMKDGG